MSFTRIKKKANEGFDCRKAQEKGREKEVKKLNIRDLIKIMENRIIEDQKKVEVAKAKDQGDRQQFN